MTDEDLQYLITHLERHRGTFRVLIKIRELNGESYIAELDSKLKINDRTISYVRGKLLTTKLITLEERLSQQDKKYRTYMVLTEKGKRVAELAAKIEEELQKE